MRTYDLKKRHGVDSTSFKTGSGIMEFLCGDGSPDGLKDFGDTENYLKRLQQEDGRFEWSSIHSYDVMNLKNTYYAVLSLKAIGSKDKGVFERAQEHALDARQGDGSFGTGQDPPEETCCALLALRAIGYGDRDEFNKFCDFIMSCRNPDGGFGPDRGNKSDIESAAFALLALQAAGTPDDKMPDSRKYVMGLKGEDGGFDSKHDGYVKGSSARNTSYAILALRAMGEPPEAIPEETRNYVKNRDTGTQIMDAYSAAVSLFALGEEVPGECAAYANKLKPGNGSFKWSTLDEKGTVCNTFCGVMTVKAAGEK